jgi:hypothetical protein
VKRSERKDTFSLTNMKELTPEPQSAAIFGYILVFGYSMRRMHGSCKVKRSWRL